MTQIGPYKVPQGVVVWPMIYALQNAAHNWERPDEFLPVGRPGLGCCVLQCASLPGATAVLRCSSSAVLAWQEVTSNLNRRRMQRLARRPSLTGALAGGP